MVFEEQEGTYKADDGERNVHDPEDDVGVPELEGVGNDRDLEMIARNFQLG